MVIDLHYVIGFAYSSSNRGVHVLMNGGGAKARFPGGDRDRVEAAWQKCRQQVE
jgi:hypothetical protein